MHRGLSADEIIKMAKSDNADISGLSQSEKLFYLQMVNIFFGYRHRLYTAEEAKQMKNMFVRDLEKYQMFESIFRHDAEIRNKQSQWFTKAEKEGCPICKKLVRIFDGREK